MVDDGEKISLGKIYPMPGGRPAHKRGCSLGAAAPAPLRAPLRRANGETHFNLAQDNMDM